MTEEQVKLLSALFKYRDTLLNGLRRQHSSKKLRVQSPSDGRYYHDGGFTIHICTEEQGAELLELIAKWDRTALQAVEQQITDMGVTLPAKEEV